MTTATIHPDDRIARRRRRYPLTFFFGLTVVLACEILLFCDVAWSHRGPIKTEAERWAIDAPVGRLGLLARFVAVNMTALVWIGWLFFLEGLLVILTGTSPVRRRPHHFALLCLASVFIWAVFDMINFNLGMRAWVYIGMPGAKDWTGLVADRGPGYFLAFGTVVPGMLLTGQVLLELGLFNWARHSRSAKRTQLAPSALADEGAKRTHPDPAAPPAGDLTKRTQLDSNPFPDWGLYLSLLGGLAMIFWVILARTPVTNYVLWTSLVFLIDPINYWLGRPSMFRDWGHGWFGRTLAAFAGGLLCGFCWEFWNYWALTKWVYQLPFLGAAEQYKYFEMPLPGLLGFIPFGIECWVMWQFMRVPLDGLAEPLPSDEHLL